MKKKAHLAIANQTDTSKAQLIRICIEPSLKLCKSAQADTVFLTSVLVITDEQTQQGAKKNISKQ